MSPKYEFQMTLIAPHQGLDVEVFKQVAETLHCHLKAVDLLSKDIVQLANASSPTLQSNLTFTDLFSEEAIQAAKTLSPNTCDVILSREGTVDIIKQYTSIPILSIEFSAWDLLQLLHPYAGHIRNVVFFRYGTFLPGLARVGEILDMCINEHVYTSMEDVRHQLLQLNLSNVDLFITRSQPVCQWAKAMGLLTLEIMDGEASANRTLREAVTIARANRSEHHRVKRFYAILNAIEEGIVVYDAKGEINLITSSAEHLLNCEKEAALGKNIQTLIPDVFSIADSATEESEHIHIQDIHGKTLVINRVPIFFQEENIGAVCSIAEAKTIHKAEKKLRKRLASNGFSTRYNFKDISERSPQLRHVKKLAKLYATTDANLLIWGESGTGKELFAQSIHAASSRKNEPFVAVNCAAIPDGLLESELFGYEGGAFTGAKQQGKIGMFELAHAGTLFLDEIGDLPLPLQGRLLRVLQEKELVRVGGTKVIPLNVRVLCATHQDLHQLMMKGHFRADLFYRLNVLLLHIPPLRDCPEEIIALAISYLRANLTTPPSEKLLTTQLKQTLLYHNWPGNTRELLSLMERMAIVANHIPTVLAWKPLLLSLWEERSFASQASTQSAAQALPIATERPLKEHLKHEEGRFIQQVVDQHEGDLSKAAHLLGISRMTLWRKLQARATESAPRL